MKLALEIINREIAQRKLANKHNHLRREICIKEIEELESVVNLLSIPIVSITLPNKDATICEGYNKAKRQDYKNRKVLRHKDQDDYYSGWMDCYDWISKSN